MRRGAGWPICKYNSNIVFNSIVQHCTVAYNIGTTLYYIVQIECARRPRGVAAGGGIALVLATLYDISNVVQCQNECSRRPRGVAGDSSVWTRLGDEISVVRVNKWVGLPWQPESARRREGREAGRKTWRDAEKP